MIRSDRLIGLLFAAILLGAQLPVRAQNVTTDDCLNQIYTAIANEQRMFRSVIFGQRSAFRSPHGSVRYLQDGSVFVKTADDTWKSATDTREFDDAQIDAEAVPPARRGLLETKKALTSELIPPILQSARALQCRLQGVSMVATESLTKKLSDPLTITVEPLGCQSMTFDRMVACGLPSTGDPPHQSEVRVGVADEAIADVLTHEFEMVSMVVSYDASYRTLLQFMGITRELGHSLRDPVLEVLARTVRTLKEFESLTCFPAQCNE